MVMSVRFCVIIGMMILVGMFMPVRMTVMLILVVGVSLVVGRIVAVKGFGFRSLVRMSAFTMIVIFVVMVLPFNLFGLMRMIRPGIVHMAMIVCAVAASGQKQRHRDARKGFVHHCSCPV